MSDTNKAAPWAALQVWWRARAERERRLLLVAAGIVVAGLVWALAVQPAWRTIARAPSAVATATGSISGLVIQ